MASLSPRKTWRTPAVCLLHNVGLLKKVLAGEVVRIMLEALDGHLLVGPCPLVYLAKAG